MQDRREPRTLDPVGRKHIAEGGGCESKPSWLPSHKTRMPANSLRAWKKNVKFVTASTALPAQSTLILLSANDLLAKEVFRQEQHIRWALCQTPHKVGIPLGAERDVDAHAPAVFHQGLLQVAPDAV